jgi:serine/threonine protein kinase
VTSELGQRLQADLGDAYRIERELPRGGMSRVFAARETALNRMVVIKVLSPELVVTLSAARFKREIQLAARLQHPHIVPLHNTGHAVDSLYFTMPLVDGESLRDRINRERPMAIENVVRILEEISSALEYAHDQGVVHRDIKPENVMFFHDRAVVLDFGIGKALTAATDDNIRNSGARITQSGMSLGTPIYVSPEQAAGDPDLDHRADIYSLGVVAYEMLCGHPPFTGRTPQVIFAAHAHDDPEPIQERRPDTPAALAKIVMRCLAKLPKDRPQSAGDLVKALRAGSPVSAMFAIPASGIRGAFARIPVWVPWLIAATATVTAVVLALS